MDKNGKRRKKLIDEKLSEKKFSSLLKNIYAMHIKRYEGREEVRIYYNRDIDINTEVIPKISANSENNVVQKIAGE